MTRYTEAVYKLCCREDQKLFLRDERCCIDKYGIDRRAYALGQHNQGRKKISECDLQPHAKQMARRLHGVLESQSGGYYDMVTHIEGKAGDLPPEILESRLDNVVYRLGWGNSRAEACQLVVHGHFTINGKRVDILSYLTKPGGVISIKESSCSSDKIKAVLETNAPRPVSKWMGLNHNTLETKVPAFPEHEDIELAVDETLIVELHSK